ncbi:nuclear transport factor 2 family protein [Streptomyces sp. NPDC056296]|uniref:nuclear transport factor 2 family protein n=1 Tax=Streptomyces sp. NPDC056296 TaxID=3345775 RepID=UPI0035E0A3C4
MEKAPAELVDLARAWIAAGHARDVDLMERLSATPEGGAVFCVASSPDSNLTLRGLLDHLKEYPPCEPVGSNPSGFVEGDVAWLFDNPKILIPGEEGASIRITVVLRRTIDGWRVVHGHLSEGVAHLE